MNCYEKFVFNNSAGAFTQSEIWAKVKKDWISERVMLRGNDGKIAAAAQILIKKIPMLGTSFMYAPRGFVCDYDDLELIEELMSDIENLQHKYNAFMLKIDPMISADDSPAIENLLKCGFKYKVKCDDKSVQCKNNYILKIDGKSKEEIFESFHKKWRYNIRLAERKGVICDFYGTDKLNDFYKLMEETAKRDGFNIRSKEYFERIIKNMGEYCRLYMCYCDGEPLSGAIAVNYGGRVSYLYGASSQKQRNVMPCYLMQWSMIKWAIETNCSIYDFMGIPHYDDETHPNYGVYRFKKGFNGEIVTYAGEFDYIYQPVRKTLVSAVLRAVSTTVL